MILLISKLIGALSAYGKPNHIASAIAFGALLAFIPGGTLCGFNIYSYVFHTHKSGCIAWKHGADTIIC